MVNSKKIITRSIGLLLSVALVISLIFNPLTLQKSYGQSIDIILTKAGEIDSNALVEPYGGFVKEEIGIINSFVAQVPVEEVTDIIKQDGIADFSFAYPVESVDNTKKQVVDDAIVSQLEDIKAITNQARKEVVEAQKAYNDQKKIVQDLLKAKVKGDNIDDEEIFEQQDLLVELGLEYKETVDILSDFEDTEGALDEELADKEDDQEKKSKYEKQIGDKNEFKKPIRFDNIYKEMTEIDEVNETGEGVTIAVLDSGVGNSNYSKEHLNIVESFRINPYAKTEDDTYGHGTHVAGIINGKGPQRVSGVAPDAEIINVKLGKDNGLVTEIDLLLGLQWVYDFKDEYDIKVVNLSVSSSVEQDYQDSPVCAAVEQLWLNGVVVVVAAGNDKTDISKVNYPPANDPFVITVGSVDDNGNEDAEDATVSEWSKRGVTGDGHAKPDIVAPGSDIISLFAGEDTMFARKYKDSIVDNHYFQMSGTSAATPIVTGTIALMLEANPDLTPNQIKAILSETDVDYEDMPDDAGVLNASEAIEFAIDEEELENLNLDGYNDWPVSDFIDADENEIDFTKLSWHDVDWLKLSWHEYDWDKLSWHKLSWHKLSWHKLSWHKLSWHKLSWH